MARPKITIEPARLVEEFAERGLQGARSDRLATLAGVAKPTLYAHGHTRESLYGLAVETEVERLLDRLSRAERLTRGRSARDRAKATAHAILNHAADRPHGLRLLARARDDELPAGPRPARASVARIPERIVTALQRDLAADGLDAGLAPWLGAALWGAALGLALGGPATRAPARERLAAIAASIVPAPPSLPPERWPAAV